MADEDEGSTDTLLAAVAAIPPSAVHRTKLGRYRIAKKLGEGGMGVVFAARHAVIERPLAIKVLKREATRDAATIQRFVQEAKAASRIKLVVENEELKNHLVVSLECVVERVADFNFQISIFIFALNCNPSIGRSSGTCSNCRCAR